MRFTASLLIQFTGDLLQLQSFYWRIFYWKLLETLSSLSLVCFSGTAFVCGARQTAETARKRSMRAHQNREIYTQHPLRRLQRMEKKLKTK